MTSNLGSSLIMEDMESGYGEITEQTKEKINELLKRTFRPEFLNRLDEIIYFSPLTKSDVRAIVDLALVSLSDRLAERRISVKLTDAAKDNVIESSYDPIYGARPLKRYLASAVETLVARELISQDPAPDTEVVIDARDGKLTATLIPPAKQ